MASDKICNTCGKTNAKACGQCHQVAYCNRDCQRNDWKEHKKICFSVGAKCLRCLEMLNKSNMLQCTVPHPEHLVRRNPRNKFYSNGISDKDGSSTSTFSCDACSKSFERSTRSTTEIALNNAPSLSVTDGPKFCYCGPHTIKPLKSNDVRRVGLKNNERIDVYHGRTDGTIGYKEYSCVVVLTTEKEDLRYGFDLYEPLDSNYDVLFEVPMMELKSIYAMEPAMTRPCTRGFVGPELKERVLAYWKQHK